MKDWQKINLRVHYLSWIQLPLVLSSRYHRVTNFANEDIMQHVISNRTRTKYDDTIIVLELVVESEGPEIKRSKDRYNEL